MKTATHTFEDGSILLLEKIDTITFPKGVKILITDPCYWFGKDKETVKDPVWMQFCDMMFPDNYEKLPEHERLFDYAKATFTTAEGRKIEFLYSSTAHGDGSYEVKKYGQYAKLISGDASFGVDAGMYAVVLIDDAKQLCPKEFEGDKFGCGSVFETTTSVTITVDGENMEGSFCCNTKDDEKHVCPECCCEEADDDGELCYSCYVEEKEREEEEKENEEESEEG